MVSPTFPQAFQRFEKQVDISEAKSTDELIRMFGQWQHRPHIPTTKQQLAIREYVEEHYPDIAIVKPKHRIKEVREIKRRHYTTITRKKTGKTRIVARIPKGKIGAGRFAKK